MTCARALSLPLATLLLLAAAFAQNTHAADWIYTVKPGDSLWELARRHCADKSCSEALIRHNGLPANGRLRVGSQVRFPTELLFRRPISARVIAATGDAELRKRDGSVQVLAVQQKINMHDRIITRVGSASVEFADGSQLLIGEQSEVVFDLLGALAESGMVDTRLRALRGRLEPRVRRDPAGGSQFHIATPTGSAVVRGTEFRVRAEPGAAASLANDSAESVVFAELESGALSFSGTSLQAGFGIRSAVDEPPQPPQPLLPAPQVINAQVESYPPHLLVWQPVEGAAGYRVLLFDSHSPPQLLHTLRSELPRIELGSLASGQSYAAIVRGIANNGLEGLDANISITTLVAPTPIQPQVRLVADQFRADQAQLQWTACPGARYEVQLSNDATFSRVLRVRETTEPILALTGPTERFVRIRCMVGGNTEALQIGPWSMPVSTSFIGISPRWPSH